jgi:hypothetical protein
MLYSDRYMGYTSSERYLVNGVHVNMHQARAQYCCVYTEAYTLRELHELLSIVA